MNSSAYGHFKARKTGKEPRTMSTSLILIGFILTYIFCPQLPAVPEHSNVIVKEFMLFAIAVYIKNVCSCCVGLTRSK